MILGCNMDIQVERNLISETASTGRITTSSEDPLVTCGLVLYQQLELSHFEDRGKLEECAKCFLQAAERGSDEAVVWIRTFLESLPVSSALENNILNPLKWFAEASSNEILVRRIAKRLFLRISDGGKPIAKCNIKGNISRIFIDQPDDPENAEFLKASAQLKSLVTNLLHASLVLDNTEEVSEETFVKAALLYAKGEYVTLEDTSLTPDMLEDFKRANIIKKVYDYPWQTLYYAKHSVLKYVERYGIKWIWTLFPIKQFYLLLLAYFLPMLNASYIISTFCSLALPVGFSVMCISTLQIINNSNKFLTFRSYSSIFQYFSEPNNKVDTQIPESRLMRRSMGSYVTFFVSAVLTIFAASLANKIPFILESLGILAGLFAAVVFFQFDCWSSSLIRIAVLSRLMSLVQLFSFVLEKYIPLYSKSVGVILSGTIFGAFPIGINVITLVQVPLQAALIFHYLFNARHWYNLYNGLGPYLVFLVYLLLCRKLFTLSSPLYLILVLFILFFVCATIPFLPLLLLLSPLIILVFYGISIQFWSTIFCLLISLLAIVIGYKYSSEIRETKWLRIPFQYVILILIITSLPGSYVFLSGYNKVYSVTAVPPVLLSDYAQYCTSWNAGNMVQTQLNCLHLQGRMFSAYGNVTSVKISHVLNPVADSLQSLPATIKNALTCFLGDTEPRCGSRKDMTTCINTGCHLGGHNKYQFEIEIQMPLLLNEKNAVSAVLVVSDRFLDVVHSLMQETTLFFNATFISGMGSDNIRLKASSLLWNNIVYAEETKEEFDGFHVLSNIWFAIKDAFLFLVDMIIGFTPAL